MYLSNLYIECFSGVSGDMFVAALLDLGANKEILLEGLKSLNIEGYDIKITNITKNGIYACDFNVILDSDIENTYNIEPKLERNIFDIYKIIDSSSISDNAKELSKKIFHIKADAEAKAHEIKLEEVYFHERGAVDSIVDIVSTAICLDNLNIKNVVVSEMYDGGGFINCRCGMIPVPVPAVVNIASKYNLKLKITDINGEMVTPTGASIIAAIKTKNTLPENYVILKSGIGAGKRSYSNDGVLRMFLY